MVAISTGSILKISIQIAKLFNKCDVSNKGFIIIDEFDDIAA
jgi:hypothetical protein